MQTILRYTIYLGVLSLLAIDGFFISQWLNEVIETRRRRNQISSTALSLFKESSLQLNNAGEPYNFPYRIMAPVQVASGQKYPLILFLHGAGERGNDNFDQLRAIPQKMASDELRDHFPCYVVAPQCPKGFHWGNTRWATENDGTPITANSILVLLLSTLVEQHSVDPQRVYLVGYSMGGFGSWSLATRHPEFFAAVVPISGGGQATQAANLVDVPIWAIHGELDQAVRVDGSRRMINAIKKAGGNPKYSELPETGHNVWEHELLNSNEILNWMFQQHK